MKIHEFQAKQLFRERGVAVLKGMWRRRLPRRRKLIRSWVGDRGGERPRFMPAAAARGRSRNNPQQRGVQLVKTADEAEKVAAGNLLGKTLVTIQTGAEGTDGQSGLRRRGLRHRPRAVPGHRARSRGGDAGADGLDRRGRRDREGRRRNARADFQGAFRSARWLAVAIRFASCARSWASGGNDRSRVPRSS